MTLPQNPCHHAGMRIAILIPVLLLAACKPDGPGYYGGPGYYSGPAYRGAPAYRGGPRPYAGGYYGPNVVSPPVHPPVYAPGVPIGQPSPFTPWGPRQPASRTMGD